MDKTSTPQLTLSAKTTRNGSKRPSELTIAFLRQFARAYHVEKQINAPINSLILN